MIWIIFVIDFLVRFIQSAGKRRYLLQNWLVAVSLFIPAIRIFRIFRVIRLLRITPVIRGIRMVRLLTSFRRSSRALKATLHRRGFEYVVAVTAIVVFAGAAGMYTFENGAEGQDGFASFSESLWWAAMLITTIGPQFWPVTAEGRILCLLLSIYAISVLGYIAATLASYFIGRDATEAVRPADVQNLQQTVDRMTELLLRTRGSLKDMQQESQPPPE